MLRGYHQHRKLGKTQPAVTALLKASEGLAVSGGAPDGKIGDGRFRGLFRAVVERLLGGDHVRSARILNASGIADGNAGSATPYTMDVMIVPPCRALRKR
jgi:hypothetical protein